VDSRVWGVPVSACLVSWVPASLLTLDSVSVAKGA